MRLPVFSRRTLVLGGLVAVAARPVALLAQSASITIGVGSDAGFAAFFLAAHERMFETENLNVSVRTYGGGGLMMDALVAQQVTLAVSTEPTNMVRFGRADLKALAIVQQSGRYIKMVVSNKVASLDKIKRFGVVPGSVGEYCSLLALKKIGLDANSVQMVKSGPPELPALLARGDIDAFFAWEPWPTQGVEQGGRVVMNSSDVGYVDQMWVTAAADWLAANQDVAQRILKVVARASDIAARDHDRTAAAVQAVTKIPLAQTLATLKDNDPKVRDFQDEDYPTYDRIAEFLVQQKITPSLVDYRRSIQRGFYKAAGK